MNQRWLANPAAGDVVGCPQRSGVRETGSVPGALFEPGAVLRPPSLEPTSLPVWNDSGVSRAASHRHFTHQRCHLVRTGPKTNINVDVSYEIQDTFCICLFELANLPFVVII